MLKASLYLKVIDRTGVAEASWEDQAEADCQLARRLIAEMEQVGRERLGMAEAEDCRALAAWSDYPHADVLKPGPNISRTPRPRSFGIWLRNVTVLAMALVFIYGVLGGAAWLIWRAVR